MRGYFSFEVEVGADVNGETNQLVACLFQGGGETIASQLSFAIESFLEESLTPDMLLVICSSDQKSSMEVALKTEEVARAFKRSPRISLRAVIFFDSSGLFADWVKVSGHDIHLIEWVNKHIECLQQHGLVELSKQNNLLIKAPAGFVFTKPSRRGGNYFIRAENWFSTSEQIRFVAFCLLRRFSVWLVKPDTICKTILIDSMSISSLAYALTELLKAVGFCSAHINIISFQSYDGLANFPIPLERTVFTIISASSSGGLATDVKTKLQRSADEVVTLVSFNAESSRDAVLFTLPKPDDWINADADTNYSGYKTIRIVGEHFLAEPLKPKRAILTRFHLSDELRQQLTYLVGNSIFRSNQRLMQSNVIAANYIDGAKLVLLEEFDKWLQCTLVDVDKIAPTVIVYQNDVASKMLAEICALRLKVPIKSEMIVADTSVESIDIVENFAVLIVAAVVGNGGKLLDISRDLRYVHKHGKRFYLCGVCVPNSFQRLTKLKKNLCQPHSLYTFHSMLELPINHTHFLDSIVAEDVLLNDWVDKVSMFNERLINNSAVGTGSIDKVFALSAPSGQPLNLAPSGFVFLGQGYQQPSQADVLTIVSSVIQRARELTQTNPSTKAALDSLTGEAFEQVVLDPECFVRFDDGIIQAALLRVCSASELDYSGSPELSGDMLRVLKSVIKHHTNFRGEALVEFLIAISIGRLKLDKFHFKDTFGAYR
jgi:hypothetical protein